MLRLTIRRFEKEIDSPSKNAKEFDIIALQGDYLFEDYLDHLCAPLVGVVPFWDRKALREEATDILELIQNQYLLQGFSMEESAHLAIRKHGSSREASSRFLEAWFAHQKRGTIARYLGLANTHALVHFGTATLVSVGLVQLRVFRPCYDYILSSYLTPAQVRSLIPEPFPLPDPSPLLVVLIVVAFLAPLIAGYLTGIAVPVRPIRAICQVLLPLIAFTFLFGELVLPTREGVLLASFMLVFWLPMGSLTAHISAALALQRRWHYIPRPPASNKIGG